MSSHAILAEKISGVAALTIDKWRKKMDMNWKYTTIVEKNALEKIEKNFNVKFPKDFKKLIIDCNAGKPSKDCFDIHNRKECILDYMIGINDNDTNSMTNFTKKMWNSGLSKNLMPIAFDPFGNIIAYKATPEGELTELVFWNHETSEEIYVAKSFTIFITMLY